MMKYFRSWSDIVFRHKWLIAILCLALFVRVVTAIWLGDVMEILPAGGTHDQVTYDLLAKRVASGQGFTYPEHYYPWVPPDTITSYYSGTMVLQLAIIYKLFGYHPLVARLFFAMLGTAIVFLIYLLASRFFGKLAGLFAAVFAALYSYLILYSATLLTETPFILLLLIAIVSAYIVVEDGNHRYLLLVGIGLAGAILFRMAVLAFVPVFLAWIYFSSRATGRKPISIGLLLIPCAIIMLAVLPWTLRNYGLYGRFMLLESQFGHVFWNSNHPEQGTNFRGPWVAPIPEELLELNEADLTYELLRRGRKFVVEDPVRFLLLTVSRIKYFFTFWPTADSSLVNNIARVLSFGILLPFMAAGLALSVRNWKRFLPIYLFLLIHIGVYVSSWVMVRYRVPADVLLLPFAALAVTQLISYLNTQRNRWVIRQVPT